MGFRPLAWNSETSLPSSGLIYTYVCLLYSTCVFSGACPVFLGISLSLKLCSIYTFDLQFTLVRVCLSKPSGLLLPPSGVLLGLTVARVWGEGEKSFSPPPRVLSGLFGFVWPRFRSSFEILIHQGKQRGGEDDLRFTFCSGLCIFSVFYFLFFWCQSCPNSDQ